MQITQWMWQMKRSVSSQKHAVNTASPSELCLVGRWCRMSSECWAGTAHSDRKGDDCFYVVWAIATVHQGRARVQQHASRKQLAVVFQFF